MKYRPFCIVLSVLAVTACTKPPGAALGTLERDRITLPAPVFERIAEIPVREGETIAAGGTIVRLESARTAARLAAAEAEAQRLDSALAEARTGARRESIAEARARLQRAESVAVNSRQELKRVQAVVERQLLPTAELDRAAANAQAAEADIAAARSALALLQNGTRAEEISQAESALAAARAEVTSLAVDLDRTEVKAPRDGVIDSLPFKVGDQVAAGTPLATLLVGEVPYARVYVPQPLRTGLRIGSAATVFVQGSETAYPGKVRSIRTEPGFTPYYALSGEDAARLSYLAEVELESAAASLPSGVPVRVEFASQDAR